MFRTQNNVPSVYVEQSRDFQLFCHLYDCIINGNHFDISTITNILDPMKVNDRVIRLLATRIGFITNIDIDANILRYILSAYPYIIRNKGTKSGIEAAVNAILKSEHSTEPPIINIVNRGESITTGHDYTVEIKTPIVLNTSTRKALEELLKYILPAGYIYDISAYAYLTGEKPLRDTYKADTDKFIYIQSDVNITSSIRGTGSPKYNEIVKNQNSDRLVNNFDTMEIVSSEAFKENLNDLELTVSKSTIPVTEDNK